MGHLNLIAMRFAETESLTSYLISNAYLKSTPADPLDQNIYVIHFYCFIMEYNFRTATSSAWQLKATILWICKTLGPLHLIPYTIWYLIAGTPPIKSSTESRTAIIFANSPQRHKARPVLAVFSFLAILKLRSRFLHRCGILNTS